jgi:hypothetical protein
MFTLLAGVIACVAVASLLISVPTPPSFPVVASSGAR